MSPLKPLVLMALTAACLPGLVSAVEPLSNKTLSNAYISGSPPAVARCKPDGSVAVGRIGDKREASPCPLLTNTEERQLTSPEDSAAITNRALLDNARANAQANTITQPLLLDNPASPNAAALQNPGGNVTVVLPGAATATPQSSSGSNLNLNSGPGGTVLNIHVPSR